MSGGTARGIEQLMIEWGRMMGIITKQRNSITNRTKAEKIRYDNAIKKGLEWLKANNPDWYKTLKK